MARSSAVPMLLACALAALAASGALQAFVAPTAPVAAPRVGVQPLLGTSAGAAPSVGGVATTAAAAAVAAAALGLAAAAARGRRTVTALRAHAVKIYDTCIGCTLCVRACPTDVLEMVPADVNAAKQVASSPRVEDCVGCKRCETACPTDFLSVRVYTENENEQTQYNYALDVYDWTAEERPENDPPYPQPWDHPGPFNGKWPERKYP